MRIDSLSTTMSIAINMTVINSRSVAAGGADITSYNLEYNNGEGSTFYEITG